MERYVAFLRGINLGNRRVKSPELIAHFEAMGFEDVATFRASGNVVFVDPGGDTEAKVQSADRSGARGGARIRRRDLPAQREGGRRDRRPRPVRRQGDQGARKGKPQVVLLGRKPSAKAKKALEEIAPDGDLMVVEGRELHWLPTVGLSETELDTKALDAALGKGTTRTAGTIEAIAAKYCA